MPYSFDPGRADVVENSIAHGTISVGTTAVEVKAKASILDSRQVVIIYNDSNTELYFGESDVATSGPRKGTPIYKKQITTFPVGEMSMYLIADSDSNNAIITEMG